MAMGEAERPVGEGEFEDVALLEVDVLDPCRRSDGTGSGQDVGVAVDGRDVTFGDEFGECDGDGAGAGADV